MVNETKIIRGTAAVLAAMCLLAFAGLLSSAASPWRLALFSVFAAEHVVLLIAYSRTCSSERARHRSYEIENMGLAKKCADQQSLLRALLIDLDPHAAADKEIALIVEAFRRIALGESTPSEKRVQMVEKRAQSSAAERAFGHRGRAKQAA